MLPMVRCRRDVTILSNVSMCYDYRSPERFRFQSISTKASQECFHVLLTNRSFSIFTFSNSNQNLSKCKYIFETCQIVQSIVINCMQHHHRHLHYRAELSTIGLRCRYVTRLEYIDDRQYDHGMFRVICTIVSQETYPSLNVLL